MPTDRPQELDPEDEPSHEQPQPRDRPEEQPPPSPDDPLLRTQSFYAERVAPLRPKDAAHTVNEADTAAEHFQQLMEEYRQRQQAPGDQAAPTTPPLADENTPAPPDTPAEATDQEEER